MYYNKNYRKAFNENLKKRFFNTHRFSEHDTNNFFLFVQRSVYSYEYIDDWEKFDETLLLEKEDLKLKYANI